MEVEIDSLLPVHLYVREDVLLRGAGVSLPTRGCRCLDSPNVLVKDRDLSDAQFDVCTCGNLCLRAVLTSTQSGCYDLMTVADVAFAALL